VRRLAAGAALCTVGVEDRSADRRALSAGLGSSPTGCLPCITLGGHGCNSERVLDDRRRARRHVEGGSEIGFWHDGGGFTEGAFYRPAFRGQRPAPPLSPSCRSGRSSHRLEQRRPIPTAPDIVMRMRQPSGPLVRWPSSGSGTSGCASRASVNRVSSDRQSR